MKIALLIPWFLPNRGGAEIGAWELARHLVQRGHSATVVTPQFRPEWPTKETMDGITVRRYFSRFPSALKRLGEVAHCLQALPGVSAILGEVQPDIVHLQYLFFTGYAGMRWAKKNHKPVLLTLIGNDVYDPYYIPCEFLNPLNRRMIHAADTLTASSNFVRDVVAQKFGVSTDAIATIPYGIDLKLFQPVDAAQRAALRTRLKLPGDAPLILTVQRLHARKAVDVYLQAAKKVLEKRSDARFVIVGDGEEHKTLEALAMTLGIADKVFFKGRATHDGELPAYYAACDLFAFHTLHEGFGIVILEAMASGLPVVTTKAGGTIDIVQQDNGILVEPKDPDALAAAILSLISNPEKLKTIARANRLRTETVYDWNTITDLYLEKYKALLNPRSVSETRTPEPILR